MHPASAAKLSELQSIISKMPLEVCFEAVLPEFGVPWREVSKAVQNARLPMTSASVARILKLHAPNLLDAEELNDIVAKLKLKSMAIRSRVWYTIRLEEKISEEPLDNFTEVLRSRIVRALRKAKNNKRMLPEVQTVNIEDLVYLSVQMVSPRKESTPLYMAVPVGLPVAFVSTLNMKNMLKACVEGLGYAKYEDVDLHGKDIKSLIRIHERSWNENHVENLTEMPEYAPVPVITKNSIDYTNSAYDEHYVDNIIGPNPPLLTDLKLDIVRPFFDPSRMRKDIKMKFSLNSEDISKSFRTWVTKGVLHPTSEFFQIFRQMKCNKMVLRPED